jgi:hypothetical protein
MTDELRISITTAFSSFFIKAFLYDFGIMDDDRLGVVGVDQYDPTINTIWSN